ncbi:MAG TPA: class I SAM-dependent methyltransferase [Candidatus Polarisedimenticolia bacterium]|nr:class I SAM-dependent methyltransferase [Candidatus Polarisedimenticolia bacterium]
MGRVGQFLSLAAAHPIEALDRLRSVAEVRLDRPPDAPYEAQPAGAALAGFPVPLLLYVQEAELRVAAGTMMQGATPFRHDHSADPLLARLCYAACRALRPAVVLETGVAHGMTTAHVLAALEANGTGTLHSIDLPPLGGRPEDIGSMVPGGLRSRWRYHRGTSRKLLPGLVRRVGPVGLFIHDSLHTASTMSVEAEAVHGALARPAVTVWDDIAGNAFFADYVRSRRPAFHAVIAPSRKESPFGVCWFA